jgi:iron complex outermembrane receptor protein
MVARFYFLSGTALALTLAGTPAFAQSATETGPPAATPPPPVEVAPPLDDGTSVIVTARRRTERLQDVPLAVSVIGGEQVDATGSTNVLRLTQIQPSLQYYSSNPRNSAANIRGLGAPFGLTNDGIEPGVGFYVDQVYYARSGSTTFDFIDVDRIEVLRGPQGTLYGKNTTAGAINVVSRAPSFDFEGRAELSVGNLGYVQARGSISGPIVDDVLALRIGVSATSRHGTIYNVTSGNWVNEQDAKGIRGQLLWRATPNLDLTLSGDFNLQNPECCAQIYVRVGATQRPLSRQFAALAAAFNYAPPSTNPFDRLTDLDGDLNARQETGGVSLRAEWQIGPGTLTSISAWRYWDWLPSNDRDFTGLPITTLSQNPSQQQQWSQELRYAGTLGRFDFVVGAFAFRQKVDTQGVQEQGSAASRWLLNPGNVPFGSSACIPVNANACNPAVLDGLRSDNDIHLRNTSLALFSQVTWRITDRLRIQPGIRVNYDDKDGSYISTVTTGTGSTVLNNDQRGVLPPLNYQATFSDWNFSYDLTLSYDLAPDVLAYATYARAFKSGGINLSGIPLDTSNNPILSTATVRPETENHFELGLKTQWFNRRLTVNLSAFRTDIHDYQVTVNNLQVNVIRGYLANADSVRVQGIELEVAARPTNNLSLYFNGAFTDGTYRNFPNAPCPPELSGGSALPRDVNGNPVGTPAAPGVPGASPDSCNISGQWLPGISRWAASYGIEYQIPNQHVLGVNGAIYAGYDGSVRSKYSSNPSRSAYTDIEGYSLSNFRLGFRGENGLDVSVWVRNAFDQNYFELLATQSGSTGLIVGQPADPRTWGGTVRWSF